MHKFTLNKNKLLKKGRKKKKEQKLKK